MFLLHGGVHRNECLEMLAAAPLDVLSAYDYFHGRDIDRGFRLLVYLSGRSRPEAPESIRECDVMLSYDTVLHYPDQRRRLRRLIRDPAMRVRSHFLDSGSFTLKTKAAAYARANRTSPWDFYETPQFWDYIDAYAAFVKKYAAGIDVYANVDAIQNPKLTWRNQKYLEREHGLCPVPVVHCGTNLKWLHRYVDAGYELIALGGLVKAHRERSRDWIEKCFKAVSVKGVPQVKFHGFGITNWKLLVRYPWWSVDSTTWVKVAAYGGIIVPPCRWGRFLFDRSPSVVKVSNESPDHCDRLRQAMSAKEREIMMAWLAEIDVPFGYIRADGEIAVPGVSNRQTERRLANLIYFERLLATLPAWPWAYKASTRRTFEL